MKKYLIGIIGALALGAAVVAVAQTVAVPNPSSLDSTALVPVIPKGQPSAQSVYATLTQLRAFVLGGNTAHSGTPVLTSCGGGSPAVAGTDLAFRVTQGTTATGCVATFSTAFTATPTCVAVNETAPGTSTPAYSVTTTAVTLVTASTSGEIWDVVCVGQ